LSFAVWAIVAEIMLGRVELNPIEVIFALNRLHGLGAVTDNSGRILTPTAASAGDHDAISNIKFLKSRCYRILVAHDD
jgi:hypothetical protein